MPARPTTAEPVTRAGRMPSTKAWPDSYPPWAAKIDAMTAMPSAPPTSRRALFAPEAMPCSWGRTLDITRCEAGAKNRAMPTPLMIRAGSWAA